MTRRLSKSRYTQFRLCDKALWLSVFKPEEAIIGEVAKGLLGDYEDMTSRRPDGSLDQTQMIERTADSQNFWENTHKYTIFTSIQTAYYIYNQLGKEVYGSCCPKPEFTGSGTFGVCRNRLFLSQTFSFKLYWKRITETDLRTVEFSAPMK